ncbi:PRK06851 family protein [Clostridium thermarum]|uniref:PRK06851 family protein n=1 Tax=Clostridium thermarum TaxID=1716543 RepID=UPI00311AB5D0
MMTGRVLNYYAEGNTARGFYSLYESNLQGLDKIFVLKGGPGTGKSTLIKNLAKEWNEKGYDVEVLHCSRENGSIDGVIIPELKVAVVNGNEPCAIVAKLPGLIEQYIDMSEALDIEKLKKHKKDMIKLTEETDEKYKLAYSKFSEALKIHDEWEKIYISNMDFAKANAITADIIERILKDVRFDKKAVVKHRFFGGATPKGTTDFVPEITKEMPKRYFIKGRPGSGKSSMLKKLAATAEERGIDVEVYHCGFDPHSLDMLIFRELGVVIFDSTSPHEYFPGRDNDEIVDMYEATIAPGTDEKYAAKLADIIKRYKKRVKEGIAALAEAKEIHDSLEEYYRYAMDFSKIEAIKVKINNYIESIK